MKNIFLQLGFYEFTPVTYRKDLPTKGVYLLANAEGHLWLEYDEGHGEHYKQSIEFGRYDYSDIATIVRILMNSMQ